VSRGGLALLPLIAPQGSLQRATALSSGAAQVATITGPALGGLVYAVSPGLPYAIMVLFWLVGMLFTGAILTDVLGFKETGREAHLVRYERGEGGPGNVVTIRETEGFLPGRMGRGSVHHIAFRAADDAQQRDMAKRLRADHRLMPTEQVDRNYFRSVYFREPGGILFEIATDQPGFAVDEPVATLGRELKLPPFLESHRREIEAALPPIEKVEKAA